MPLLRMLYGLLLLCLLGYATARAAPSFWVWNRFSPLEGEEDKQLLAQGITRLYWHVGTLTQNVSGWNWREAPRSPSRLKSPSVEIIPVVRLEFGAGLPLSQVSREQVTALLKPWVEAENILSLQLDCDCPDRNLPDYAALCRQLKNEIPSLHLEITALASWGSKINNLFAGCIDGVSPMFYDLDPTRERLQNEFPAPLFEEISLRRNLSLWQKCSIPWRAGLPYFTRVTLFDEKGWSLGHPRNVPVEDLLYNTALLPGKNGIGGSFMMNASRPGLLGNTPFQAGNSFAFRAPYLKALALIAKEAMADGAEGITYFRLPEPGRGAVQSLSGLLPENGPAVIQLERSADGAYLLKNMGPSDLLPSALAPDKRGYILRIKSATPIWREAMPGDFHATFFTSSTTPTGSHVPAPLADQLDFWFSHLPAGAQLSTGWVRYAAGQNHASLQYQLISPQQIGPWQKLP